MSSRTKGFFEQDHTKKPRPAHWHRGNHGKAPLADTTNTAAPPKPAIPATSQAKAKLKAFQCDTAQPEPIRASTEGKENGNAIGSNVSAAERVKVQNAGSSSAPLQIGKAAGSSESTTAVTTKTPQLPHANTFPSTPGVRLSLEDLIGDVDTKKEVVQKEQSPEEHIGWIPNSSSTQLTPNRRRKRARSSSPSCPNTSSQRNEASAFFPSSTEKRTPEADPAADLWQRYGLGKENAGAFKLPDLPNIQRSPRPLETPVRSGGFRRWASTGNDWPSSRAKKRRTNDSAKVSLWQRGQVESTGRSKVAAMVESIQESLATQKLGRPKQAAVGDEPSSSSPLPDTGAEFAQRRQDISPIEASRAIPPARPTSSRREAPPSRAGPPQKLQPHTAAQPCRKQPDQVQTRESTVSNVQYMGEDLTSAPLHLQSRAPLPAFKRPSISRTPSAPSPVPQVAPPALPGVTEDFDEFGDAMEFSAEDLDELMSQVPMQNRKLHEIPEYREQPAPPVQPPKAAVQQQNPVVIGDDDDDEFGGDDLDEDTFVEAEIQATQAQRSPSKRSPRKSRSPHKRRLDVQSSFGTQSVGYANASQRYRRFLVKQVVEGEYTNDKGRRCVERVLVAEEHRSKLSVAITLRDSWSHTPVAKGNVLHVSHLPGQKRAIESSPAVQIELNDSEQSAFVIVEPDHMLSATTVADSFDCIRKAVLQDRIKATGETSEPMVYGKILHEIFQQSLTSNRWDEPFLADLVDRTIQAHVDDLWELGMRDTVQATEKIRAKMGELAAWAKVFVRDQPSDSSLVEDRNGEKVWMSVSKLIAIEEHVWSPQYGLKGNVDATIQATLKDDPRRAPKQLVTPFEVKTGRTTQSTAHHAQTALYTLLLSDRYDVNVQAGILYYLESSAMSRIAPPVREVRQMVQQRNRLASYIYRARYPAMFEAEEAEMQLQDIEVSGLPTMKREPRKCDRCYAKQSCFTFHALTEDGTAETAGMLDDGKKNFALSWHEDVGHLVHTTAKGGPGATTLRAWFTKWDRLLTFEESETSRFRKELWTMPSTQREAAGRCFGNLIISHDLTSTAAAAASSLIDGVEGSGGKINRFTYAFARAAGMTGSTFAEGSQLVVGEPIVVSSEGGQWALANGYVVAVSKTAITVAVDRRLGDARERLNGFEDQCNQSFRGIMDVARESKSAGPLSPQPTLYRLDKDEFSNGLALIRNNLVTLMSNHPIHTKLRNQIVFDEPPTFSSTSDLPTLPRSQLGDMNDDQRAAVSKVLSANDYALILGMPGTGKTTTIAHVIRALLAEGKSILLASYTHTAVDNILLKIRDVAPKNSILRLGVPAKINPEVQNFCQLAATPRHSIDEIEEAYMHSSRIVSTTCMGTNHALFSRRSFDVCIVDEASQITLPISLGPLLHARKFVLVGDHFQLPPLVQNRAALEGGLDVSLFKQLSERFPQAVAMLGRQYRMCEEAMGLSNELIYGGKLRCGNDAVGQRTLRLPIDDGLSSLHQQGTTCGPRCWVQHLASPANKVIFANTDPLGPTALETLSSSRTITNPLEATLTLHLVASLLRLGVPAKEIGIITLYRSQLSLLRQLFKSAHLSPEIEIDSADRFQGRDKEVVVLSMVRSNEKGEVGELLRDWRRVNVAMTRARSKFVVLGGRRTLGCDGLLRRFLELCDGKGYSFNLPEGADAMHDFGFSSQSTAVIAATAGKGVPRSTPSPTKRRTKIGSSPMTVLGESRSGGNRSPVKSPAGVMKPGKVVQGRKMMNAKHAKIREQIVIDIFEDLTGEEF